MYICPALIHVETDIDSRHGYCTLSSRCSGPLHSFHKHLSYTHLTNVWRTLNGMTDNFCMEQ